jgi:type IV secretory pathway ATPase VirB11/archaellum biosynthesis ATPase
MHLGVIKLQIGSAAVLLGNIHSGHEQLLTVLGGDPVNALDHIIVSAGKGIPLEIHLDLFLVRF